ncbi:MAG: hypothetical protein NTY83_00005 [Candidatus Micrarchaeota archaeon]|nr:hypothetical protein [Candidatus Micrarchaeota archaeon]
MEPPTGRILLIIAGFLFLATIFLMVQTAFLGNELSFTKTNLEERNAQLDAANSEILSLNGTLIRTEAELSDTREELRNTGVELNITRMDLNETSEELEDTRGELRETQGSLEEAMEEFVQLRDEVVGIEESVNSSIQWFRDNAELPRTLNHFFWESDAGCTGGGTLRLACLPFLMEKKIGFTYKSEYPDQLLSIDEMVDKPGGDCEDYSLFLKAYINRLKNTGTDRELEAWGQGGERYVIFEEDDGTRWYVWGSGHPLGSLQDLNPYAICFTTKYEAETFEGHCIVALSASKINSVEDMQNLDGAETFEPQNGQYTGRVGEQYRVCQEGDTLCDRVPGSIIFVIADEDLYQFIGGEWVSYELYGEKASELEQKIDDMVEK